VLAKGSGRRRWGLSALAALALAGCASGEVSQGGIRNSDAAARVRVAQAAEASGQPDVALSMYAAASSAAPNEAEVQAQYAAALARNGQLQEAEQLLAGKLERAPRQTRLLLAVGQLRLRMGSAAEALAAFDQVLAQAPRDLAALSGRGVALDLLGRHADAQLSYRTALAVDASHVPSANNLAFSLMLDGQSGEAVPILAALRRRPGTPPRVATNLGIAQAASGDARSAEATLEGRINAADLTRITSALGGAQPAMAPAPTRRITARP
jgi:Flp pilus assembly protein TadD